MIVRLPATLFAAVASALCISACGTPPRELDLTLQHPSRDGKFVVRVDPPAGGFAINQLHGWQLHLSTPDGRPVSQASLGIDGGMPQHGHGYPTRPRVTRELSPGVYALDGMKFSMAGWWDLKIAIQAGGVADSAVFNVIVTDQGLQR